LFHKEIYCENKNSTKTSNEKTTKVLELQLRLDHETTNQHAIAASSESDLIACHYSDFFLYLALSLTPFLAPCFLQFWTAVHFKRPPHHYKPVPD